MEPQDFLALIEQRLGALESRLERIADRQLTAEINRTIEIARVDLPFALAKARYVLELIVREIDQCERPAGKPKPLFNMTEDLCAEQGLFGAKIATDINYIRINGNLIVHAHDESVAVTERQVEVIVLMIINLVEWYLTDYLSAVPGRARRPSPSCPRRPTPTAACSPSARSTPTTISAASRTWPTSWPRSSGSRW